MLNIDNIYTKNYIIIITHPLLKTDNLSKFYILNVSISDIFCQS